MAWFVTYVKSGTELDVVERVGRQGINAYCPLVHGKPAFKNYIFVKSSPRWRVVLDDLDVWYILMNDETPVTVSDAKVLELEGLAVQHPVAITTQKPRAGDEITLRGGLMEGCKCLVLKAKKHNMFLVQIGSTNLLVPLKLLQMLD